MLHRTFFFLPLLILLLCHYTLFQLCHCHSGRLLCVFIYARVLPARCVYFFKRRTSKSRIVVVSYSQPGGDRFVNKYKKKKRSIGIGFFTPRRTPFFLRPRPNLSRNTLESRHTHTHIMYGHTILYHYRIPIKVMYE